MDPNRNESNEQNNNNNRPKRRILVTLIIAIAIVLLVSSIYNMIASSVVDDRMRSTNLKNGWNHIQLPLSKTRVSIGADYVDQFTNDLTLTQLVFYIAGTGKTEEQNYLIRYDNMYVAKTADLQAAKDAMK